MAQLLPTRTAAARHRPDTHPTQDEPNHLTTPTSPARPHECTDHTGRNHSAQAYSSEIEHFAQRFRVLSFDLAGGGGSTREVRYQDEREYDLWNFQADTACHVLMELGIEDCYVLGSGFAAWSALHLAGKQARLHRLTVRGAIADSFLGAIDARTLHRALDKREHYYLRRVDWLKQQHGDDWRAVVDADTAFLRRLAQRGGYELPPGVLNAVRCPVLLTGSMQDDVLPGIADEYARLARLIPECSIYLARRSDHRYGDEHPLLWTAPGPFRALADLFLAKASV